MQASALSCLGFSGWWPFMSPELLGPVADVVVVHNLVVIE
jgi:hypothetical protein